MILHDATIYLGAATVAVVLSRKLGFGAVLGYLFAGVLVGPWCLRLITNVESILHFSEIGVVFLLFIIGLELQPSRLWVLRRTVFGLGSLQVLITGAVLTGVARWFSLDWAPAILIGFGLSLSSTAFVLQMLAERKELTTAHGRAAFGVLLFQDLAVIPLIALVPLLASDGPSMRSALHFEEILKAVLVLVGFVVGGHYLLRPILRMVASAQIHEIFTAAALLVVLGAAVLMESLGLSMGLGAFLAGMLVADSEYRHQLEADIAPFKGLLLGLFFIAVGMSANLGLLVDEPGVIFSITLGLIALKAAILIPLARAFRLKGGTALTLSMVLAQGGEFAFVLFHLAAAEGLLSELLTSRLILAVTLSMAATPLLYILTIRLSKSVSPKQDERPYDEVGDTHHQVIIAGFGRFGQVIGRILAMRKIPFTALEASSDQVDFVRRYGNKVYYGDAGRLDLLRSAQVDKAKVFVLALDDVEASIRIAETVKHHFPDLHLAARARNRQHALQLMEVGADFIIRDTLLSSISLAGDVLEDIGLSRREAEAATAFFLQHDTQTLEKQYAFHHDEGALIQSSRDASEELRELFNADANT
ncbi:MAG: glutathione-regulated potassium-efflux system protein KefB [Gammaproteobacteria bacterium]|jgi:glutathione-regulated potassium-efflux system ancillary protein KefC/glutathione-regulated potassium-efflux system protein KefB|nr:glutathione-regulated potassium-efflux system protein KefB [Gammaproteobacteria bacterium]